MQDFYDAIKTLASGRVYPLVAPENAGIPFLVYTPIIREQIRGLDGFQNLTRYRVQVDAYAKTYAAAYALSAQVTTALDGAFQLATAQMVVEDYEEQTKLYRVGMDYIYHD